MKRRHYRIHYTDHAQPMKRVKRREIPWGSIVLVLIALAIIAVGVFAIVKWVGMNGAA